jgi:hypothetical protein
MGLEADVAKVLRVEPAGRINFTVEQATVSKSQMEHVAKAIDNGDVAIEVASTGHQLGAAYSSFVSRRWAEGEKKLIGKITLGNAGVVRTALGKSSIFHESVHALMDVRGIKIAMQQDEVVAYIADALYLRATRTPVSGDAAAMAIFNAAFALVDGHKMLTKPGVILKWTDCSALHDAVKAHPAYR